MQTLNEKLAKATNSTDLQKVINSHVSIAQNFLTPQSFSLAPLNLEGNRKRHGFVTSFRQQLPLYSASMEPYSVDFCSVPYGVLFPQKVRLPESPVP